MGYITKRERGIEMKKKEEILIRAICLLTFADRCALEEKVTNGIKHSLSEREQQRKAILQWLIEKNYYNYLTFKEKNALDTQVKNEINNDIYSQENDYECIEPLLWSVGIIDELHNYDDFVLDDLHIPLNIGRDHTLEGLVKRCNEVSDDTLLKRREIAMLWYWRCLEGRIVSSEVTDYRSSIRKLFSEEYIKLLENDRFFDKEKNDFIVKGKVVSELNNLELAKLEIISERRFYAFEWLCSDEDWTDINLIC